MNNDIKETVLRLLGKFKADKKTLMIILIGIVGMLLIFISETSENISDESVSYSEINTDADLFEEKLEKLISKIDGAGRVKVMITYQGSTENIYAYDFSVKENDSDISEEREHIIIDKGDDEGGLLLKEIYPQVLGVAVVCDGGSSPAVKSEITALLKALFDIGSNSISITKMSN